MATDLRIRIVRVPKGKRRLFSKLLGLYLPVRSYLLVRTTEPCHSGDELVYLVHNDDIWAALQARSHLHEGAWFKKHFPIGQVTCVPINCCEVVAT